MVDRNKYNMLVVGGLGNTDPKVTYGQAFGFNIGEVQLNKNEHQAYKWDIVWNTSKASTQKELDAIDAKVKINCDAKSFNDCGDKWKTYKRLLNKDIPQVSTSLENDYGYPVIMKYTFGSFGNYVFLAHDINEERNVILKLHNEIDHEIYLGATDLGKIIYQPFMQKAVGTDITVYVVGGEVVASMKRANTKDFRSHVFRGGIGTVYNLSDEEKELSIRIVKEMNLDVCSLNYLLDDAGKLTLCEVNANPGLDVIQQVTGVDVMGTVYNYIEKRLEESVNNDTRNEE